MNVKTDRAFIEDIAKNKREMIYFLSHVSEFFLPPSKYLTNKFIGQILAGKKKMLKVSDLKSSWIPPQSQYVKLADIYKSAKEIVPDLDQYMPIVPKGG